MSAWHNHHKALREEQKNFSIIPSWGSRSNTELQTPW